MCSFWSGSMNQKLLKPVEWVRHMRGVIFSQRGSSARSWIRPVLVRENRIGPIARQRLVEIVLDGRVEVELALIDQLHHRVGKHRLGERRAVHDGVRGQRISLGVADAVGLDIADLAVIDDRYGHAVGVGARLMIFFTRASIAAGPGMVCPIDTKGRQSRAKKNFFVMTVVGCLTGVERCSWPGIRQRYARPLSFRWGPRGLRRQR